MALGSTPAQHDVNEMNRKKGNKKQTNDQKVLWKVLPCDKTRRVVAQGRSVPISRFVSLPGQFGLAFFPDRLASLALANNPSQGYFYRKILNPLVPQQRHQKRITFLRKPHPFH